MTSAEEQYTILTRMVNKVIGDIENIEQGSAHVIILAHADTTTSGIEDVTQYATSI